MHHNTLFHFGEAAISHAELCAETLLNADPDKMLHSLDKDGFYYMLYGDELKYLIIFSRFFDPEANFVTLRGCPTGPGRQAGRDEIMRHIGSAKRFATEVLERCKELRA